MRPEARKRLRGILGGAALALGVGGLVARGLGDRTMVSAVLGYATPWLVGVALGSTGALLTRRHGRGVGIALVLVGALEGSRSWRHHPAPPGEPTEALVVAVWNAGRDLAGRPEAWRFDADLVVVVESGSFADEEWKRFVGTEPDRRWKRLDGGTMIGIRGEFLGHDDFSRHDRFRCHRVAVRVDPKAGTGPFTLDVVGVDIRSQPWRSREDAIRTAFEVAGEGPAVVAGDFNTPPASRWFGDFAGDYALANRAQSRGFLETWAWGLPLHTLDQIWVSPDFEALDARQQARGSDHRLVEATLARRKQID